MPTDLVFAKLKSTSSGLTSAEARRRLAQFGANALRTHHARGFMVLLRQLKNPILILLASTVLVSAYLGDLANSLVIVAILVMSVGLGFFTEYRAEKASEALHSRVHHRVLVRRDGHLVEVDVVELVPGDIVSLKLGSVVPADIRLLEVVEFECDESIITGESVPVSKQVAAVASNSGMLNLASAALMGTVVHSGSALGVVVQTGAQTEFGKIALQLGNRQPETDFQKGLRKFSVFLLWVALALTSLIFVGNLLLNRPLIESLMFSLAIAVGMTPQLLPAVVSTGLALGSKRLAAIGVMVKQLVSIEDLGDIDILVTDKTGTLTDGRLGFAGAVNIGTKDVKLLGLLAVESDYARHSTDASGLSPLDAALWSQLEPGMLSGYARLSQLPFNHETRMSSALVRSPNGETLLITKGSAEDVLARCTDVPPSFQATLDAEYANGSRVVAVATRAATDSNKIADADVAGLTVNGLLVFTDPPKVSAAESLQELARLGIRVKIATGDNAAVAEKVCRDLGLEVGETLTGAQIDLFTEEELPQRVLEASIFARVSPDQKARIIRALRGRGLSVGFLGDGVNDAIALHDADVGISVDSGADVAKDAANVVLLEKNLGVLAAGVREGRRTFSNTMKYVFMGTSGDFGNMFSASIGSVALNFLPMLPSQVLLNDMLYDSSQLAIPSDRVDEEQIAKPSHWDIKMIRRFMLVFGPISSIFDFATFALMLLVFHAGESEFQSGWFIESLATETLIVFAVRTRRVPFFKSIPSRGLAFSVLSVVAIGAYLPYSPIAGVLGFSPLPAPFFLALMAMIAIYLWLVETAKRRFFARMLSHPVTRHPRLIGAGHRVGRRASRFSHRPTVARPNSRAAE